jgi:hypothetical protein
MPVDRAAAATALVILTGIAGMIGFAYVADRIAVRRPRARLLVTAAVGPVSAVVVEVVHPALRATAISTLAVVQNSSGLAIGTVLAGVALGPVRPHRRVCRAAAAVCRVRRDVCYGAPAVSAGRTGPEIRKA